MATRYYGYPRTKGVEIISYAVNVTDLHSINPLPLRRDVSDHAEAFAWGHVRIGTRESKAIVPGAAQLALALLCHALNNDGRALALHQRFKMRVMDKWDPLKTWSMTPEEIAATCDKIEEDEPSAAQRDAIAREPVVGDREPSAGVASAVTSAGHRNDIPGEKVRDDDG